MKDFIAVLISSLICSKQLSECAHIPYIPHLTTREQCSTGCICSYHQRPQACGYRMPLSIICLRTVALLSFSLCAFCSPHCDAHKLKPLKCTCFLQLLFHFLFQGKIYYLLMHLYFLTFDSRFTQIFKIRNSYRMHNVRNRQHGSILAHGNNLF